MKIVIFGLSITSAWGNGHATTFRALCEALHARGRDIVFFEKDLEWYASNRDLPEPPFCRLVLYEDWGKLAPTAKKEVADCDVVVVGSYFPDGIQAIDLVLDSKAPCKAFYDIDTPVTVSQLRQTGKTHYLLASQIPGFDLYFSFTGGPMLCEIEERFGAQRAVPLYCSFDPRKYRSFGVNQRFACDLSYMGTYASDRQPGIEEFLLRPALQLPHERFIVAGPQYPKDIRWPQNVRRIVHLNPRWHARFYSSSRLTLNVTRREMAIAGYSPSVRLFEAAACGTTIVSDKWPGLETFFRPGQEVLLPTTGADVIQYLTAAAHADLRRIGCAAQERVLAEHTSEHRAREFEDYVVSSGTQQLATSIAG